MEKSDEFACMLKDAHSVIWAYFSKILITGNDRAHPN
jgi:hypothetical protein